MNGFKQVSGEEAPPPDQVGREYRTVATQFHLHNSSFEGHEQAVNELFRFSLMRDGRQSLADVREHLWSAGARFTKALMRYRKAPTDTHHLALLETLAEIVYRTCQEYSYTRYDPVLHLVASCFANPANISLSQAYQVSLAKYRLPRSASQEEVHAAIRNALSLQ